MSELPDAPVPAAGPRSRRRAALAVFLLSLLIYNANCRWIGALDSRPARLLPLSLLTAGSVYLDRFEPIMQQELASYWYLRTPAGHLISFYPIVVPLLAAPLFIPAALWLLRDGAATPGVLLLAEMCEKAAASVIAAASVALMFVLLRRFTTASTAVLLTIAYAFATETWMISSQALWLHGLSELLLAALFLALLRPNAGSVSLAGLLTGLLVVNRPPNVVFGAGALVYVLLHHRRHALRFVAVAGGIVAIFLGYNLSQASGLLGGYTPWASTTSFNFDRAVLDGFAGLLVSPARGLLLFSPFFVFLALAPRYRAAPPLGGLLRCFVPAAALQLLLFAAFRYWPGGACYGPRYLTDMLPILVLALVPVVDRLGWAGRLAFAALVAFGIGVQAIGAFCYPMGHSQMAADVWDLSNVQYVRELRGGSVGLPFIDAVQQVEWSPAPP